MPSDDVLERAEAYERAQDRHEETVTELRRALAEALNGWEAALRANAAIVGCSLVPGRIDQLRKLIA